MSESTEPLMPTPPVSRVAAHDGAEARRRGEPRDPTPYLPRYQGQQKTLIRPEDAWLMAYDQEDARLRFEHSRPAFAGQDLWSFLRRRPESGQGTVADDAVHLPGDVNFDNDDRAPPARTPPIE